MSNPDNTHAGPVELSADAAEVTGAGLRVVEIGLIGFVGLLVWPPAMILAVTVVVPTAVILAVLAAVVGMIALPVYLVRRVRTHHRDHGKTVFLHRLVP